MCSVVCGVLAYALCVGCLGSTLISAFCVQRVCVLCVSHAMHTGLHPTPSVLGGIADVAGRVAWSVAMCLQGQARYVGLPLGCAKSHGSGSSPVVLMILVL